MGKFKLFKKKEKSEKRSKGFHPIAIQAIQKLTSDSVQVTLDIPAELDAKYQFTPGQYLDFEIEVGGEKLRRSYSICSGPDESIAFAVKSIPDGKVSNWFNNSAKTGDTLAVSEPNGLFVWTPEQKNIVTIASGSGITPILSIAKHAAKAGASVKGFYGNKTQNSMMFAEDIKTQFSKEFDLFYTQEEVDGAVHGRLNGESISSKIKEDLNLLKADAFFICGPQEMIAEVTDKLKLFGVPENKIKRELFTASQAIEEKTESTEAVKSQVTVILDGETVELNFKPKGKSILELLDAEGYDPPYSCRGGVCSTCKAKVLEGAATMKVNYVLTEEEVANGEILCCQAQPTTENIKISFDE